MQALTQIKRIRKQADLTQEELSDLSGIPLSTLRRWEQSGSDIRNAQRLVPIAEVLNCTVDDLLGRELPKGAIRVVPGATIEIPLKGRIAAGEPIEMLPTDDTIEVLASLAEGDPDIFALIVDGDSMNKVLPKYSYAIVSPTSEVLDGRVYALNINGYDATIKRVERLNNGFRLLPDSTDPTYLPQTFDFNNPETENVRIIGRVKTHVMPPDYEL